MELKVGGMALTGMPSSVVVVVVVVNVEVFVARGSKSDFKNILVH
jgi:hypothetical protein